MKKRRRKCTSGKSSLGRGIAAYVFTGDIPSADKSACDITSKAALTHEYAKFLVAMRQGDTPVPIPNTMVKTLTADGTMLETAWESRWLPE